MFTGIIELIGQVQEIEQDNGNTHFVISSGISDELKVDQSVAHNGTCLTVVEVGDGRHKVTAIEETLKKTSLGQLNVGDSVNLERCMPMNGRFDGHVVYGHVDGLGRVESIDEKDGSTEFRFSYDKEFANLMIEKGSICINGISLTVWDVDLESFKVAIIPYTLEHTTMHQLKVGSAVNLEFDPVGKYINRIMNNRKA